MPGAKHCSCSYSVMGLHQSYNNESVLKRLELMKATVSFFEDWIDEPTRFYADISALVEQHKDRFTGIELDMDSIIGMPSSAFTPSGVTVEQARYYVRSMARVNQIAYIHFPEAAPVSERDEQLVGKSLSYLVTDFIKCHNSVSRKLTTLLTMLSRGFSKTNRLRDTVFFSVSIVVSSPET